MKSILGSVILAFLSSACSYQPEEAGLCKLNCSGAIISGNDAVMSIEVKTEAPTTTCAAAAAGQTIGPYTAHFLIGEKFNDGKNDNIRPVPNISIEPLLNGIRPTLQNENDADDRYRGILTPRSNWCSDSCGVVTLQVASVCPPSGLDNELSIQIHSGALYSNAATFSITTEE